MPEIAVIHTVTWTLEEWRRLNAAGSVRYLSGYPANEAELAERIGRAALVVGADVAFSAAVIEACPRMQLLALWSTGYNNVDLAAAQRRSVTVCNVPGYAAQSVAEHAWAMALHLAKQIGAADAHVRAGMFDWSAIQGLEIHGLTVGIIGMGSIGECSAAIARGFGCHVLAFTRRPSEERAAALGVRFVDLMTLLAHSDIIMLHAALNNGTRDLLDRPAFAAMTRRPILVNTARGDIIGQAALVEALAEDRIRAVGLDVLWEEPPNWSEPVIQRLLVEGRVLLSPHCASHTEAAFRRLTAGCLDNVEAFLAGRPIHVLSASPLHKE